MLVLTEAQVPSSRAAADWPTRLCWQKLALLLIFAQWGQQINRFSEKLVNMQLDSD